MSNLNKSVKDLLIKKALAKRINQNKKKDISSQRPNHYIGSPDLAKYCQFERFSAYQQLEVLHKGAEQLEIQDPFFKQHEKLEGGITWIKGKKYINYANYNYLNLANERAVKDAAISAIEQYGTSASASRIVSGERAISKELEFELAKAYGVDDALVFVSGHATNVTTIGYLFEKNDLIIHDALIHNSVLQGIQLSGAKRLSFKHNDYYDLEKILIKERENFNRVLIVLEGLYGMDGDYPDLPKFIQIKNQHHALLMVDEAHSFGVMGEHGLGIKEHYQLKGTEVDIWMGTLSKVLAGCGGYIAGNEALIKHLRYCAPGFLYSVGIVPATAASSVAALKIMLAEPERVHSLQKNSQLFLKLAKERGFNVGFSQGYAVVPILVKNSTKAVSLTNYLFEHDINVQPILYPAVEEKMARLRFFLSSHHTAQQIKETIEKLALAMKAI